MVKVYISTMSDTLAAVNEGFANEFGIGPCGAFAALKREEGWGQVAVCLAETRDGSFPFSHYVIWDDGIVDLANPFDAPLHYTDIEILDADEMPECVDSREIDWLRERGV